MRKSKVFVLSMIGIFFMVMNMSSKESSVTKLTQAEIKEMVDVHNEWRMKVHNDSIEWSDELAKSAQEWADKLAKSCNMKHSNTKNGENIYWSSFNSTSKQVVDEWCSEIEFYKGTKIKSGFDKYGHYTQVVWQNTKQVGAGKAICRNGSEIWVCQYFPAGNVVGEFPYEKRRK